MTAPPLIAAEGVGVRLGGREVLRAVDLSIRREEIVTLVGPNGSGKSTLLRVLIGALRPDAGRVRRAPGLRIGYVPQRLAVDRALPMTLARFLDMPRPQGRARREAALASVGLSVDPRMPLDALSGGQLQRAMLARALIDEPQLLILDEPTQGLDQNGEAAFYRLVADVRARLGCAVLMVSHDLHVVMAASDRVICLNGHICCQGAPQAVSEAPEYRALFGAGTRGALALYRHEHDHRHDLPEPAEE